MIEYRLQKYLLQIFLSSYFVVTKATITPSICLGWDRMEWPYLSRRLDWRVRLRSTARPSGLAETRPEIAQERRLQNSGQTGRRSICAAEGEAYCTRVELGRSCPSRG